MKKLFILGSTRGLGKEILKLAVNEEFEIRCLVRDQQKVQKNKNLKIARMFAVRRINNIKYIKWKKNRNKSFYEYLTEKED